MSDEKKDGIRGALQSLAKTVADAIDDLASLEVTTYIGSFNLGIDNILEKNENKFKIKSLMQSNPATLNVKLELLAYSRFEIDADVSNIVKQNMNIQDKEVLTAHNELVKTALEARKSMLNFAVDLISHE